MKALSFVIGGVLPYLAFLVFLAGMTWRITVWIRTNQPGKLTVFPAPSATWKGVLAEALFFPGLFRGDKLLWTLSWIFHVTLALVLFGHVRVFTGAIDRLLLELGMTPDGIHALSAGLGGAAGVVLVATGALLLLRRLVLARAREISGMPDFAVLLLVLAVIVTGDLMRFGAEFDLEQTRIWFWSLVTLAPRVPENGLFLAHAALALLLVAVMPFSKLLHFGGIFFTQALIKRS